jgi:hypothetical protein
MEISFKNGKDDEEDFIAQIHHLNLSYWTKNKLDEHELVKTLVAKPRLNHHNNLLFYHWYERRYRVNVISKSVLRNLNEVINVTKKELHDDVRDRMLEYMGSTRFNGFTIYHEYFFDFFPELESFNFAQFCGQEFVKYLLELFPVCKEIDYLGKKRFIRFKGKELLDIEKNGTMILSYRAHRFPCFYPHIHDSIKFHTYSPHSLLEIGRKEIENIIRIEKALPKIGEGWISETLLFYQVKEAFPDIRVMHHGAPNWLRPQHFDVYMPELGIAIEYQGKQHSEPVEYFGGQEAFIKNIERDERKRNLCEINGLRLLYVYPDTDTTRFIAELKLIIRKIKRGV